MAPRPLFPQGPSRPARTCSPTSSDPCSDILGSRQRYLAKRYLADRVQTGTETWSDPSIWVAALSALQALSIPFQWLWVAGWISMLGSTSPFGQPNWITS